jgi:Mn2+/Fe2+ NRAMP family transporter
MVAVQVISARLGRVTERGVANNLRENFPAPVLYALVTMLLVANTINVAADVAAMGQSLQLVVAVQYSCTPLASGSCVLRWSFTFPSAAT